MEQKNKRPVCAPCHRYILQNLKTKTDVSEFERSFLSESLQNGMNKDEAYAYLETLLIYLPQDGIITRKDFMLSEYSDYDSLYGVLSDNPYLKKYQSCRSFYRRFDSGTSMCAMCSKSDAYRNRYKDREAALLKYVMADISHHDALKDRLNASMFHSVFDLGDGMQLPKPVIISAYAFIYDAFCQNIYEYFNYGFGDHPSSALLNSFVTAVSRAKRLPQAITSRKNWSGVLFRIVMDTILNAPDIPMEEAEDTISLLGRQKLAKEKAPAKSGRTPKRKKELPAPDPEDMVLSTAADNRTHMELPLKEVDCREEITAAEPDKDDSATVVQLSFQPPILLPGDPYSRYHRADQPAVPELSIPETAGKCPENTTSKTGSDQPEEVPYRIIEDKRHTPEPEDIYPEDLSPCVTVSAEDLKDAGRLTGDTLSRFEECMKQDSCVFVEVVTAQDMGHLEYLFLFYLRKINSFYYVSADDPDTLKFCRPYLEQNTYRKICFAPYLLYGVGMLYDIHVKNVHSIMTAHYLIERSSHNHLYGDILKLYEPNLHTLPEDDEKAESACPYLYGMPLYAGARHNQLRIIGEKNLKRDYEDQLRFDELLGRSYIRERFFPVKDQLFDLKRPGGYQFHDYKNLRPVCPGSVVTYTIDHAQGTGLIKNILLSLAGKGRFRTMHICLLGMTATSFTLFLEQDVMDYMNVQIHLSAVEQLKRYQKKKHSDERLVIRHTQKDYPA